MKTDSAVEVFIMVIIWMKQSHMLQKGKKHGNISLSS
jgi:hypothetical protein